MASRDVVVVAAGYPADGAPGPVRVLSLAAALQRLPDAAELAAYPGPLVKGNTFCSFAPFFRPFNLKPSPRPVSLPSSHAHTMADECKRAVKNSQIYWPSQAQRTRRV